MPEVKFYKPEDSVRWIVKQFETIKFNNHKVIHTDHFIPRPDVALVFHFKNTPKIIAPVNNFLPAAFIACIASQPIQLRMEGELDSFIVICKPSVLSKILGINMASKANLYIQLSDNRIKKLWQSLAAKSGSGRIKCFSDFINDLGRTDYFPDDIDRVYDGITGNCLQKNLQEITEDCCCSVSSLQRNFYKRVGVTMKRLMRIARINAIFNKMQVEDSFNYQKIIFENNYYDQAHFIKDFKTITGQNPKNFFFSNSTLCRVISGISKESI